MRLTIDTEFFAPARPRAIAHRGDSGAFPENTLESFRSAATAGAPYIELDVHMTLDGEIVVAHDPHLERMCAHPGRIAHLAHAELAAADAGHNFRADDGSYPYRGRGIRVPRLADVLAEFPRQRFMVEVKQAEPSLIGPLLAIIDRADARRRTIVVSEHQRPLDEVRALAPDIATNFSALEVGALFQALAGRDARYRPPGDVLQIPPTYESWKLVTPEVVALAHRVGCEVHVWTVNDPAEMRALLDLGVDGLITDFPARLLAILAERARR